MVYVLCVGLLCSSRKLFKHRCIRAASSSLRLVTEHGKIKRRQGLLLRAIPGGCQVLAIGCAAVSQSSENGSRPPNKDVTAPSCTLSCLVSARSGGAVPARPLLWGLRRPELWSRRAGCRLLGDLLIELAVSEGDSARRVAYVAVGGATIEQESSDSDPWNKLTCIITGEAFGWADAVPEW